MTKERYDELKSRAFIIYGKQFKTININLEPMNITTMGNMVKDINEIVKYINDEIKVDDPYEFASIIWVLNMTKQGE